MSHHPHLHPHAPPVLDVAALVRELAHEARGVVQSGRGRDAGRLLDRIRKLRRAPEFATGNPLGRWLANLEGEVARAALYAACVTC